MLWNTRKRVPAAKWLTPLLLMGLQTTSAASLYSIGNSLTNDMYPDAVPALAQDAGLSLSTGYHIRGSASLTYMVAFPADVTLSKPATHDVALISQDFDAISLQPYTGFDSPTYTSERAAIVTFIERVLQAGHGQTVFYLYAAWPNLGDSGGDFDAYWRQSTGIDLHDIPRQTHGFYDALLADLRVHFGSRASVRVIPVGDVLARIDRDGKSGLIPGISDMSMLYRDTLHMGEVGRFVAASTVLATLFQQKPASGAGQAFYQLNDGAALLTPILAAQLEDLIWSVVSADDRTRATSASSSSAGSSSSAAGSSSSASSSSASVSSSASSSASSDTSRSSVASSSSATTANSGGGSMDLVLLLGLLTGLYSRRVAACAGHHVHA